MEAAMSRWFFHTNLVTALNSKADELILNIKHRLEITEVISQVLSVIPASNMTVPSINTIDTGSLLVLLAKMRACITSNIHELRAFRLSSDRISETFGEGSDLLLGDLRTEICGLFEKIHEAAQEYQRALGELRSQPLPPDTEWPPDVCEIDFDAIEERGKTESGAIFRRLVDLASAEMSIAFGQTGDALEKLKPYLGTTDAEDPEEE
jgi:hypothetical protein